MSVSNSDEEKQASSKIGEESSQRPERTRSQGTAGASSWRRWIVLKMSKPPPIPLEPKPSRERSANPLSRMFFTWIDPLMVTGYNRQIDPKDIPTLPETRKTKHNNDRIYEEFRMRAAKGDKNALLGALNHVFFWEYWIGGSLNLLATLCMTFSPFMLKYIIRYATEAYIGQSTDTGRGVGLAIGLIALQMFASICINQFFYQCMMVGGMVRASLISMIYAKSQVISARAKAGGAETAPVAESTKPTKKKSPKGGEDGAKKEADEQGWSNGRVSNLMSTDTYRIDQAAAWTHIVWTTPIQIAITLVQLIINLGPSALAGFALLLIMTPVMGLAGTFSSNFQYNHKWYRYRQI